MLVEQLHRQHRVLQALRGVAQQPVDVRPDQMHPGLQLGGAVLDGPVVDPPDLPRRAGQVAVAHEHVGPAQPGAVQQEVVTERGGLLFDGGGGGERRGGVPEVLVLDRQRGGRHLRRVRHGSGRLPPLPLTAICSTPRAGR
jgi:hypothetical protein